MDDAINARTKKRVHAQELARQRGWRAQDFECPGCGNPVHLRAGKSRAPHFAHLPGYTNEDCSYYHGGVGGGAGDGGGLRERAPLPLYLEIISGFAGEAIWSLQLAIPRITSIRGRITVVDGITGRSTLSCAALANGGRRIPVKLQQAEYRVEVSPDVNEEDAERLLVGSPGLDPDAPTLFRAGGSGGRRLGDEDDLTWGESYFAIWKSESAPSYPPAVAEQELVRLDNGYRGGVFQLPMEVNDEVLTWVADRLYRRVAAPGVILRVICPLTLPSADEELEIDSREEVVVAVSSPGGTHGLRDLTLVDDETKVVRRLRLKNGADTPLVSLGVIGQRRVVVSVENNDGEIQAELTLHGCQRPLQLAAAAAELIFGNGTHPDATSIVPLHSRMASKVFVGLKDGGKTLEEAHFPLAVPCRIRANGHVQQFVPGSNSDQCHRLLDQINQLVSNGSEFELDAESFGRVTVPARKKATARAGEKLRLTAERRLRLRALSTLAASRVESGIPMTLDHKLASRLTSSIQRLSSADAVLIRSFVGLRWNAGVLPQVRALATEIIRSDASLSQRSERIS